MQKKTLKKRKEKPGKRWKRQRQFTEENVSMTKEHKHSILPEIRKIQIKIHSRILSYFYQIKGGNLKGYLLGRV